MTFATPLALLALPLVPLTVLALYLARRRRIRYAIRYPALDVLAGGGEGERGGGGPGAAAVLVCGRPHGAAGGRGQADGAGPRPPRRGHGHAGHRRVRVDERRRRGADPDGGGPAGGQRLP